MANKNDKIIKLNDFVLVNPDKVKRAKIGSIGHGGKLYGGVGENATPEVLLAEYDRLGGLVENKQGNKIKTGSFYDFENKKPRDKKEVVYLFRDITGKKVELKEEEEIPLEVKAAEVAEKANKKEKEEKIRKTKG